MAKICKIRAGKLNICADVFDFSSLSLFYSRSTVDGSMNKLDLNEIGEFLGYFSLAIFEYII